ncbi:hypothetical protein NDU88_002764 [Pleurodeles waltl]|uniref:Uncharacterized protein n=1 Tax=Pleurodeles waltl TaxID=8319 RepID=A0AAV7W1J4_PLEWA|nr:hypothetical protein NDU88_002764 [Pleurodeles waltl]
MPELAPLDPTGKFPKELKPGKSTEREQRKAGVERPQTHSREQQPDRKVRRRGRTYTLSDKAQKRKEPPGTVPKPKQEWKKYPDSSRHRNRIKEAPTLGPEKAANKKAPNVYNLPPPPKGPTRPPRSPDLEARESQLKGEQDQSPLQSLGPQRPGPNDQNQHQSGRQANPQERSQKTGQGNAHQERPIGNRRHNKAAAPRTAKQRAKIKHTQSSDRAPGKKEAG